MEVASCHSFGVSNFVINFGKFVHLCSRVFFVRFRLLFVEGQLALVAPVACTSALWPPAV